ncbi:MAG TPA: radical SAM protein [Bacillales bacterium]|nr:radical SAM protein [Bacillales bacterium]
MPAPFYEKMIAKHTLNRVKESHMPFDWSINPYRGCFHGCSFCYARATHSFLGMRADDSFQNHIFMKENAAEALRKQLARMMSKHRGNVNAVAREIGFVAIGTATDPYQPIEGKVKLTRQCLEVLADFGIPASITTRSPLVLRDLDLLRQMNIVSVNVSISTLDNEICRRLEPGASYPRRRLEMVQQLTENGIPTGIFMAPILPCLTDSAGEIERLISQARHHGAEFVSPSVLRLTPEVKEWFFRMIKQYYPQLLSAYLGLYRGSYPSSTYAETLMKAVHSLLDRYGFSKPAPESRYMRKQDSAEMESQGEQLSFSF